MKSSEPRQVGLRFLSLTLVTFAGAIWVTWRYKLSMPATVVALLPGLGGTYLSWKQFHTAGTKPAAELTMAQVADQFAVAVKNYWGEEAGYRRLYDPPPLPVTWQPAEPNLVDGWHDLIATAKGWPGGRAISSEIGPVDLAGDGNDLADVLARIPTGRLVVLGEPGAGKTILLIHLLLTLLARRNPGGPVPVLAGLAGWNPSQQGLTSWLTSRLTRDYPALADPAPSAAGVVSRAKALLDRGLLLPILDGLDELPGSVIATALTKINDGLGPGQGVVVASRLDTYRTATTGTATASTSRTKTASVPPSVTARLLGAAGITLQPVTPSDVAAYLRGRADPIAKARWEPVVNALRTGAPVAQALESPLLVALARTIYNPRPGEHAGIVPDPAELCDQTQLPSVGAVRAHLFDAFIRAAYRPDSPYGDRWKPDQAERWLGFLARHLRDDRHNASDIAWWQLRLAVPWPLLGAAGGFVLGLALLLGAGLEVERTSDLSPRLIHWILLGLIVGLGGGFWGWRKATKAARSDWFPARRLPWQPRRLADSLGLGLVAGLAFGLFFGLQFGLRAGLAGGFVGLMSGFGAGFVETSSPDLTAAADPQVLLTQDRGVFFLGGLLTWVVFEFAFELFFPLGSLTARFVGGLVVTGLALAFALMGFTESAWGWFVLTRCWLVLRGRLPWHLMAFLADAHRREVLRRAGASYQFRHVELQHHLAARPR